MSVRKAISISFVLFLIIAGIYPVTSILKSALFPVFRTYQSIQTLPEYRDPVAFTTSFASSNTQTTELQRKCKTGFFYCREQYISSPLYPHKELKMTIISIPTCHFEYETGKQTNLSTEGRYLYADFFWNVFWIEIDRCGEKSKFFGPFRSLIKLHDL